jgi:cbb3-type cytochrome oxidase maturation protein
MYLVLFLALSGAGVAVAAFVWVVRSGQLDDVDTPPHRILFDDECPAPGIVRSSDKVATPRPPEVSGLRTERLGTKLRGAGS